MPALGEKCNEMMVSLDSSLFFFFGRKISKTIDGKVCRHTEKNERVSLEWLAAM